MAVYTDVAAEELAEFLKGYDIGELLSYKGIAEGVENSNFLVHTSKGAFILTLYEKRVAVDDLPYFLSLMAHLCARGVRCPHVVLRAKKALRTVPLGGTLVLECTDPLVVIDVPHFIKQTGHRIATQERDGELYVFRIVKQR